MREFGECDQVGEEGLEYDKWLRENPRGLVLNRKPNRKGLLLIHKARCKTISYAPGEADAHGGTRKKRTAKVCFETPGECDEWKTENAELQIQQFCPQCRRF